MTSENDQTSTPVKKRELSSAEQQRIQALRNRNIGEEDKPADFFKLRTVEDSNAFIESVIKQDLTFQDGQDEQEARCLESTGFSDTQISGHLLVNIAKAMCKADASVDDSIVMMNRVGHYMKQFRPKDAIEGTLCAQIIVCQERGLELLQKACAQTKSPEWARTYHNASSKLFARAQAAIQTLVSYRRGGQQKVVVEHVNIAPGGQAAFGTFQAGGGGVNGTNHQRTL